MFRDTASAGRRLPVRQRAVGCSAWRQRPWRQALERRSVGAAAVKDRPPTGQPDAAGLNQIAS